MGGWLNRELKFLGLFLALISFSNLVFSNNTFALFTPTLSASVDQANLQVNGNQVINSTNKTTEIPLNLTVNTNNKTGYTATLSAETENTALTNATSTVGAKINSIGTNLSLNNLPNNTWGYRFGVSTDYAPIPALSTPTQIIQTTTKTSGNEVSQIILGMKLSDNLESGNYTNKLILSFVSNPYQMRAVMTEGPDFNTKLKVLETATNKIEHFKKSTVAPAASMNAVNIEDEESECEIKLWLDLTDKTAYYYAETEKVYLNTDSSKMFYREYGIEHTIENILELDLSNFDTSNVTNMQSMFHGMSSLTSLNLSNFDTSKVTNMEGMFYGVSNLISLDLSNFDTSKVTNMRNMFSYIINLMNNLDLSNFDTSNVTDMSYMFSNIYNLNLFNFSNFNTSKVKDMSYMFYRVGFITSLDLSNFNTSNVTNMSYMFSNIYSLASLNLSNFDTSNVTDMSYMFDNTYSLRSLDLSSFDTSKVTDMSGMFRTLRRLTSLNLSNFNTTNVTNMSSMFYGMYELTSLNLSNFNTTNVTNMSSMFYEVWNLASLDLSNFDTSNVTDMSAMFYNMFGLTSLDLSSFNTSKVTDMRYMFSILDYYRSNDKLNKIYVNNDFNTSSLMNSSDMFTYRYKLRGGNGSYLANPSLADKTWLRVDRPGVQGYFTRKP